MSAHTPGPWHVEELTGIAVCRIHDTEEDSERSWISNVYDDDSWERCKANARLIAAAPSLLAALEAIVQSACEAVEADATGLGLLQPADYRAAWNAIAEARGEVQR